MSADGTTSIGFKHYFWVMLWWLSLGYVIMENAALPGVFFLVFFFMITSWKALRMAIFLPIIIGAICSVFPFLTSVVFVVGIMGTLLKIRFLLRNWRALLVGMYAYGVYALILVMTKTAGLVTYLFSVNLSLSLLMTMGLSFGFAGILTLELNSLLKWLYRHNYTTDTAFGIMGVTPLLLIGFILPLLKFADNELSFDAFDADEADIDSNDEGTLDRLPRAAGQVKELFTSANAGDIDAVLWSTIEDIPPYVHAAMAIAAAYGAYKADNYVAKIEIDGRGKFTVNHSDKGTCEIYDPNGKLIATTTYDQATNSENIKMAAGKSFRIDYDNGEILNSKGESRGHIFRDTDGNWHIQDKKNQIVGTYTSSGLMLNKANKTIGGLVSD